jgi:hypothetical protein
MPPLTVQCRLIPSLGLVQPGCRCYSRIRSCSSYPFPSEPSQLILNTPDLPSRNLLNAAYGRMGQSQFSYQLLAPLIMFGIRRLRVLILCPGGVRLPSRRSPCRCQREIDYCRSEDQSDMVTAIASRFNVQVTVMF